MPGSDKLPDELEPWNADANGMECRQKKWGSRLGTGAPEGAFRCRCRFHTGAWGHPS